MNSQKFNSQKQSKKLFSKSTFCPSYNGTIDTIIRNVLDETRDELSTQNITVETDLESFSAIVDKRLVESAVKSLLKNAALTLQEGGEISVALIDGKYQWELEVADGTGIQSFEELAERNQRAIQSQKDSEFDLPTIIPFPLTEQLQTAHHLALAHGGHIQTWDCPQGGTANVLVIPRRRSRSKDSSSFENQIA